MGEKRQWRHYANEKMGKQNASIDIKSQFIFNKSGSGSYMTLSDLPEFFGGRPTSR